MLDVDLGDIGDFIFGGFMKEVVKKYNLIKFWHQWTDQYNLFFLVLRIFSLQMLLITHSSAVSARKLKHITILCKNDQNHVQASSPLHCIDIACLSRVNHQPPPAFTLAPPHYWHYQPSTRLFSSSLFNARDYYSLPPALLSTCLPTLIIYSCNLVAVCNCSFIELQWSVFSFIL